jgi:hypothetical protein
MAIGQVRSAQVRSAGLARTVLYWLATAFVAFVFAGGGAVQLFHPEPAVQGMAALGYPEYMLTILGAWKVLGGLVILAPRLGLLKEWAYAGILFDLTGASFSHAMVHAPIGNVIAPLVILGVAAVSYALRPAGRTLRPAAAQ